MLILMILFNFDGHECLDFRSAGATWIKLIQDLERRLSRSLIYSIYLIEVAPALRKCNAEKGKSHLINENI